MRDFLCEPLFLFYFFGIMNMVSKKGKVMEIINYYNEKNSEKLGCADRDYVHDNNLWHREIAVWVMNNNREILLERRSPKKKNGANKLSVVAGHVDKDETESIAALRELEIGVEPEELIVGNRTKGVRYGVVFPESGCSWIDREFETLPTRDQDKFLVRDEDIKEFRETIYPYWNGRSMEDVIRHNYGEKIDEIAKVVKINQKDHAQGHICPDTEMWLRLGVNGLIDKIHQKQKYCKPEQEEFYECTLIVLDGVKDFMKRYHDHIYAMLDDLDDQYRESLQNVADICLALTQRAPETFHEALQSLWFLFVVLHMESNASSFSPGRMDQYLYPYYRSDVASGYMTRQEALELMECLWLKFNQIVY